MCEGNVTELTSDLRVVHVACSLILALAGTVGNALAIALIYRTHMIRTAPTMMLIIDFCLANMVSSVFILPIIAASSFFSNWMLNSAFCQMFAYIMYVALTTECLILMTITIGQYLVIVHRVSNKPVLHHHRCLRLSVILGLPWIIPIGVYLIPLIHIWDEFGYDSKKGYCSLLSKEESIGFLTVGSITLIATMTIVTFYCYAAIFFVHFSAQRKVIPISNAAATKFKGNARNAHLIKMISVILLNYLFTYLPFMITSVADPCLKRTSESLYTAIIYISWSHVTTNPAIYALMNSRINSTWCSFLACRRSNVPKAAPTKVMSSIRDRNIELNSAI